jgi:hypothetical protein
VFQKGHILNNIKFPDLFEQRCDIELSLKQLLTPLIHLLPPFEPLFSDFIAKTARDQETFGSVVLPIREFKGVASKDIFTQVHVGFKVDALVSWIGQPFKYLLVFHFLLAGHRP